VRQIGHVALDMDGTIYSGASLFNDTLPFLKLLDQLGIGHTFLTNNSSKNTRDYIEQLKQMGIVTGADQLYTSTQATIEYFRADHSDIRRLFVLGTPSLGEEVEAAGFTLTRDDAGDPPEAVVIGFDTTLIFSRLCRAANWIKAGKPFITTHPDRVCPTDQPTILVDCGSICAALEQATGRRPDRVLGKPDPCMIRGILRRNGLLPDQIAMVGDRLYTDMAMARQAGALGVLVLTGETTAADVSQAKLPPDLVVKDLGELAEELRREWDVPQTRS